MKKQLFFLNLFLFITVIGFSQTVQRIEAETFDEASGARAETNASLSGGGNVGYITNGTWIKFSAHVFNEYDGRFDVAAASNNAGGSVEFRLDTFDGPLVGTATVAGTGGWTNYQIVSTTITQTTGTHDLYLVFNGGSGYLFNLDYIEKVTNNPNAVTYTLTTGVTPEGSGTVTSNVSGTTQVEGTEITLTANDNFGYDFVKWVDENGTEVSTNNPYTFTIASNTTLIAEFAAVNTYILTVNVEGAYGLGDYSVTPAGKDGGFTEYEVGTTVTITALENDIIKFSNWDNGSTDLTRSVTLNQNTTVTGTYTNDNFIAGWTFKNDQYAHPRIAELYSNVVNRPELYAYNFATDAITPNVRTIFRGGKMGFCVWNTNRGDIFYFKTSFSTVGYKNITITSGLMGYYYGCDEWTFQYSLDGVNFINVSDLATINTSSITPIGGTLPTEAEGKEIVYIRWFPNVNGPKHNNPADVTATLLSNISLKAESSSLGITDISNNQIKAFPNPATDLVTLELLNAVRELEYTVYTIQGNKVLTGSLIPMENKSVLNVKSLNSGIYVIDFKSQDGLNYKLKLVKK